LRQLKQIQRCRVAQWWQKKWKEEHTWNTCSFIMFFS
jgi:hypothetical protein